ncbi:hypothetical protein [Phyllobacterium leguminum]|uniref:Gluconate kinase n=1 Tax=Phyllobacterium leguminum TaxID=314237 RepID=A0A318T622_9HYPH|nr:hypothetical protein [Phyllobacterium leguminum]PYE88674.1 gluconate kinase [Phyllobacterium leguminum]
MAQPVSAISITGSSHTGKTTLAIRLADRLGWPLISTDKLARHPGRPWRDIPPAVAEFYANLSPETIYWFLRVHHENMWPALKQKIEAEALAGHPFVIEGSALRPEYLATLNSTGMVVVCLYGETDFLRDRMHREAGYEEADAYQRVRIGKFIERSLRDNAEMRAAAQTHGMRIVDASDAAAMETLLHMLIEKATA